MSTPALNTGIPWHAIISVGATTQVVKAAVTGKTIVVTSYSLLVKGATTLTFKTATTAISGAMVAAAADVRLEANDGHVGVMVCANGEALNLVSSSDGAYGNIAGVLI